MVITSLRAAAGQLRIDSFGKLPGSPKQPLAPAVGASSICSKTSWCQSPMPFSVALVHLGVPQWSLGTLGYAQSAPVGHTRIWTAKHPLVFPLTSCCPVRVVWVSVCLHHPKDVPFELAFESPQPELRNSFGAVECNSCVLGSYAAQEGSTECTLCGLGEYANDTGMTSCYKCAADAAQLDMWTTSQEVSTDTGSRILEVHFSEICDVFWYALNLLICLCCLRK